MKKEELLSYINHAIQVESNMLSQQNLIREYDENSEKRKPQLILEEAPEDGRGKCCSKPKSYGAILLGGVLIVLSIIIYNALAKAFDAEGELMDFLVIFTIIGVPGICAMVYGFIKLNEYAEKENAYNVKSQNAVIYNKDQRNKYAINLRCWEESNRKAHAYFSKPLSETKAILDELYSADIIYSKYRNLPALTSIYEYLITGRCEELTGPHGAYNLYEDELRKDTIISQMNLVIQNLEQIKSNQYMLYEQVKKIQAASRAAVAELRAIHGYAANIADYASLTAYYAGITAVNTSVSDYCHTL